MHTNNHWMIIAGTALLASCGTNNAGDKPMASAPPAIIEMKDFFKNPEKAGFRISPDGQYISYRAPWNNRMNIFVRKIGDTTATQVTADTVRDIGGYFWKGSRLVYSRDINGDENYIVFSASVDGKDVKMLTPEKGVRAGILDDLKDVPGMEQSVMIQMNQRNPEVFDPYTVNIETGKLTSLYNNKENYESWTTDHSGTIRITTKTDGVNTTYYHRANDKEPFKEFLSTSFKDTFSPQLFTFDNKNLIAASNLGRDKVAIVEYDLATNKEIRMINENPDYDMEGVDWSHKRKVLTMAYYTGWKQERDFLDDETKAMYEKMAPKFAGYEFWIYGEDDTETKFVVWTGNDRYLGKYYFYDQAADKLEELAELAPWLKEGDMAEMKPIQYQSRDGLTIHGYLTLPKGREARNLPVVVNPHGGPWARDSWGFNSEAQFLANRGYAVLQMNFRGSTGYGKKFFESSFKQWGRTMQDDITDGVKWMTDQGIADPKRIAIYGGSYGGYATLAGVTFTPDLYACGVDYVGVSNLFTFMNTIPPYWKPYLDMFHEMVGDPAADKDSLMMREVSPVFHVDKIKCPLFIAQGANDPRVNKDESDQVVEALKARGVEVQYMVKDNEGHGFHNEENRFDFYGGMEAFLDQHIGSGYKAATEGAADAGATEAAPAEATEGEKKPG